MFFYLDTKAKVRFEKLQTMGEAKYALKFMFSKAAKIHKEKIDIQNKLTEIQESCQDVSKYIFKILQIYTFPHGSLVKH